MKKNILMIYQDWNNWFLNDYDKFEFWFKTLDKAYDKNYNYYVLVLGNFNKKFRVEKNIYVEIIKSSSSFQFFQFNKLRNRIIEIQNKFKPSIVYCPFLYLASVIKKKKGIRYIGFLRDKTPEMITAKGGIKYFIGKLFYILDYLAFRKLDVVLYNGESLEKYAKKLNFKGKLIYNPRNVSDINFFNKSVPNKEMMYLKSKGNKIIFSIGRLVKGKNMDFAIDSLSNLPNNFHLFIIGEGEELNELKLQVKKLNIFKRVHFLGYIKHNQIWQYYKAADIFWLLSKTDFEGTPNVLQEAFYAQVPSITTNLDCMRNIVDNDINSLILKSWDPKEVAEKTLKLINNDKLYNKIKKEQKVKINNIIKKNKCVVEFFN